MASKNAAHALLEDTSTSKGIVVELEEVTIAYGSEVIIPKASLEIRGPGLVQVLGPNGAGKTTLLRTILGFIRPLHGRVKINGVDVTGDPPRVGRYAGYVPQLEPASKHYPITPWELVETECLVRCKGASRDHIEHMTRQSLSLVGLAEEAWSKPISRLSGGQRQRVFIARAIVHNPPLLIMDEPFSAVDPAGKASLAELIGSLSETRLIMVTSHDPMLLLEHTTLIILINRGIVAYGPPEEVLRPEILAKVYGGAVMSVREHPHIVDEHGYYAWRR